MKPPITNGIRHKRGDRDLAPCVGREKKNMEHNIIRQRVPPPLRVKNR